MDIDASSPSPSSSEGSSSGASRIDSRTEICAAHSLFEQGRFVDAVKIFKRHPQHPIARYLLGEAYERAPEYRNQRHLAPLHYIGAVDELPDLAAPRLACCYANGVGVAKSSRHALYWYLIAGHSGAVGGYINAAGLLWKGCGEVEQDRAAAYAYMFVAGALDDKQANDACAVMFAKLTPQEEETGFAQAHTIMGARNLWRELYEVDAPAIYSQDLQVLDALEQAERLIERAKTRWKL